MRRCSGLAARFVHFADLAAPLSAAQRSILEQLLTYGAAAPQGAAAAPGEAILIVPRAGTISPWSSKATDIAHVCGLERGAARGARHRVPGECRGRAGA